MSEPGKPFFCEAEEDIDQENYIRYLEGELAQARRQEEIGMLAAVVAHDLNNILTPIFGYSTILKRDMEEGHPFTKAVGVMEKSAERASQIVSKLLGCSRSVESRKIPFDIAELIEKMLENVSAEVSCIDKCYCSEPFAVGDSHQIGVVIRAVFRNAIEAMGDDGKLSITVERITVDSEFCRHHPPVKPGPHLCITIKDCGCGMAHDVLEKVFEPFFSTKPPADCAGIGLVISRSLLRHNLGCIELESIEAKGTTVKIHLPAAKK